MTRNTLCAGGREGALYLFDKSNGHVWYCWRLKENRIWKSLLRSGSATKGGTLAQAVSGIRVGRFRDRRAAAWTNAHYHPGEGPGSGPQNNPREAGECNTLEYAHDGGSGGLREKSIRRIWHKHGLKPHLSRTFQSQQRSGIRRKTGSDC